MSADQQDYLEAIVRSHRSEQRFVLRANIILLCADGMTGKAIAQKLAIRPNTVSKWINRWIDFFTPAQLASSQSKTEEEQEEQLELKAVLGDSPRPGTPPTFDVEACVAIVALACELPSKHNREITNWTHRELREEILMQKLVSEISVRQVGRILAEAQLQPHRNRYWLNSKGDPKKDERIADICDCYNKALQNPKHEVYYNFDEATGIQAIERIAKDIAMEACKPRRVEFEYKRHGTTCLLAARDIATGIVTGWCNPTRTEEDTLNFIADLIDQDPVRRRHHIICDNLNTHKSESLVRLVAAIEGDTQDLGIKDKTGILKNIESREKYLTDSEHEIVFHYTPKHASWINQIEVWFSILVRKLLRWLSVKNVDELNAKILNFINYYNRTMAKAFKWNYQPKSRPSTSLS